MEYIFEGNFQTLRYKDQSRGRNMLKGDNPELSFKLNSSSEVRKLGKRAALVVDHADRLHGHLEITSRRSFQIRAATIFFEGTSRNWVSGARGNDIILDIRKAERKFLSQTFDIPASAIGDAAVSTEGFQSSIPFHFIISKEILTADPHLPDHCLQLPPSIELGPVFVDAVSGKRFAQPSINYELRASVCFVAQGEGTTIPIETLIPIIIMPHTEEFPPTSTLDFPSDFKEVESKPVKWSMFGPLLGTMRISMREPRPLSYNGSSVCGITDSQLDLEFFPADLQDAVQTLQAMKFTLLSSLRVKTFYAIESFPHLPSQTLVDVHGKTKMRHGIIKLPKRELHVQWGYKYSLEGNDGDLGVSPAGSPLDSVISQSGARTEIKPLGPSQSPNGRWIATVRYPIRVESQLLPTFCSSIAARLYTVIHRLKVSGIRKESFYLEVPLQVINMSPEGLTDDTAVLGHTINASVAENPPPFELRRSSAASWFTDESLVCRSPPSKPPSMTHWKQEIEDDPPHYHP